MLNDLWYMNVEPRIYSLIKARTIKQLKTSYPNIMFTSVGQLSTDDTFSHVVYIHELPGVESGKDLSNDGINAYLSTFEVIVSVTEENKDNTKDKKQEVMEIAGVITNAFKKLRFDVISMPVLSITSGAYTCPIRFRRMIGCNDNDLLGN